MNTDIKKLEWKVGVFILIGIITLGSLVIFFGRFGQTLKPRYSLKVEFPNANGLLMNSKVLMYGAAIGNVVSSPKVENKTGGISVDVRIDRHVQIPKNASFIVGSSGLLGDRFVDVIPKPDPSPDFYKSGDVVHGDRQAGMDELTREGGMLLSELRTAVSSLNGMLSRVDKEMLTNETFEKLASTMANLESTTNNFKDSSGKIDSLLTSTEGIVDDVKTTVSGVKTTFDSAQLTANELRAAIADTRKVLSSVKKAAEEAINGHGLIATLLNDKELSKNLNALISNLKRSGVLFYKDRPAVQAVR